MYGSVCVCVRDRQTDRRFVCAEHFAVHTGHFLVGNCGLFPRVTVTDRCDSPSPRLLHGLCAAGRHCAFALLGENCVCDVISYVTLTGSSSFHLSVAGVCRWNAIVSAELVALPTKTTKKDNKKRRLLLL